MIRTPYDKRRHGAPILRRADCSPARASWSPSRTCGASSSRRGLHHLEGRHRKMDGMPRPGWHCSPGPTGRSRHVRLLVPGRHPGDAGARTQPSSRGDAAAGSRQLDSLPLLRDHGRRRGRNGRRPRLVPRATAASSGSKIQLPPIADFRPIWSSLPVVDMMKKAAAPRPTGRTSCRTSREIRGGTSSGTSSRTTGSTCPSLQVNSWYDFGVAETLQQFNQFRTNAESASARDNQFIIISPTEHCRSELATEKTVVGAARSRRCQIRVLGSVSSLVRSLAEGRRQRRDAYAQSPAICNGPERLARRAGMAARPHAVHQVLPAQQRCERTADPATAR